MTVSVSCIVVFSPVLELASEEVGTETLVEEEEVEVEAEVPWEPSD